jgi:3-methyladenine DNA glycosylase AlkD
MTSALTERAGAFVAERLPQARELAARVAALVDRPEEFVVELHAGYARLADPAYLAALRQMTPGLGAALGIRTPLAAPVHSRVRSACRHRPDIALWLAERLEREPDLEMRTVACTLLRISLEHDPERSWQLIRRLSRTADNWIAVDTLAGVAGLGILLEPFRWAELEQLVYSPSPWERRFVGSTIASLPFEVVPADRHRLADSPALDLVGELLGDSDANVQRALAWALRSWHRVDGAAVERLLDDEASRAVDSRDGHRAWVIRDALPALDRSRAAEIRARIAGLRRDPRAASTSRASRAAAAFADLMAASPATGTPEATAVRHIERSPTE